MQLHRLKPGTMFQIPALGLSAELVKCNECRALVRLAKPDRVVTFTGRDGEQREFVAKCGSVVSWTPFVEVEPE